MGVVINGNFGGGGGGGDDDDKKAQAKARATALLGGTKPARKPRAKPQPVGPGTVVNVTASGQAQAAGRDIHNHINETTVVRPTVVRGPEFISSSGARKIQELVKTLVELETAAGAPNERRLYAKYYKMLKDHFAVPSYLEIPAHQEQQAIDWLRQRKLPLRSKLRCNANDLWRNEHYKGIWARTREAGKSRADVYQLVAERLQKHVASLKSLGERDLKALYQYIMSNW